MKKQILFFTALLALVSCGPMNDDIVQSPSKDGSIEMQVSIEKSGSLNILKIDYTVWSKNAKHHAGVAIDTLPDLGITSEEAENEDGEVKTVKVPKEYELYITVK
jgi:hypothetical protein